MKLDLDDGEQFQRVFVKPMIDAMKAEIKPIISASRNHEKRLERLENNQKKALLGFGAVSSVLALAVGSVVEWSKRKLGL